MTIEKELLQSFIADPQFYEDVISTSPPSSDATASATPANGSQLSPNSADNGGVNGAAAAVGAGVLATAVGGRKRPLLAGGPRTSMTPTKRTVMSLLARARAAQAKQLPPSFPRANPLQERTPTLVPLLREDYIAGAVNLNLI
ncbi:uncharacterized protein LOC111692416 [Anoplophora glabripennis]|uniref:uncharacterized protein LOC111692416 n=1 Tax=Anoplophora glabripennis TaxID=217634 RepID=UPI000C75C72A|nr:uncharacterized protein LOC111692416 [Anoplophora glabripennis]